MEERCIAQHTLERNPAFCRLHALLPEDDRPFILSPTHPQKRTLSYRRLHEFVRDMAGRMRELGIRQSDRVAVLLPNCPESGTALFALTVGCCYAPMSASLSRGELEWALADLPAAALVLPEGSSEDSAGVQAAAALGIRVLELREDIETIGVFELVGPVPSQCWAVPCGAEPAEQPMDSPVLMLHTSGTTNRPKLVPLSAQNLGCAALCVANTLKLQSRDVCLNMMPLHHLHGIAVNVLATGIAGGSVVCAPGLQEGGGSFFEMSRRFGVTWYSAVPSIHLSILEHKLLHNPAPLPLLRLIRNCSAALLPSVAERMEAAFECVVLATYAMTECIPICSNPLDGPRKVGSVGPAAGPWLRVLRADRAEADCGEEGQVAVKGPCMTRGYEAREWHCQSDWLTDDGWLLTGDKGYLDEDGYLYLSGRFKEIVNRGGEKISPFTVEEVLSRHPAVMQCVAFSTPHTLLGEVVGLAAVLREGWERPSLASLRQFGQQQHSIELKWLPEQLVWMTALPKGGTGKPQRIGLARMLGLEPIDAGRESPREWVAVAPCFEEQGATSSGKRWVLSAIDRGKGLEDEMSTLSACTAAVEQLLMLDKCDPHQPLRQLGLDSINAAALTSKLSRQFEGLQLGPGFPLECATIANMAAAIDREVESALVPTCLCYVHNPTTGFVRAGSAMDFAGDLGRFHDQRSRSGQPISAGQTKHQRRSGTSSLQTTPPPGSGSPGMATSPAFRQWLSLGLTRAW
eukprot:TRINITY_DN12655_c0_g1_i1.p1 TRINITY_DN12655_c0_g1~~TRINITY_DN12655_c0_g1_i1.p1  ORF type:complete len:744 (+),score=118.13 TRINITY_DN12655_c0_g1_i1:24-2255(+)